MSEALSFDHKIWDGYTKLGRGEMVADHRMDHRPEVSFSSYHYTTMLSSSSSSMLAVVPVPPSVVASAGILKSENVFFSTSRVVHGSSPKVDNIITIPGIDKGSRI